VLDLASSDMTEPVRAALFELGMSGGSATIVCVADGTTSLYTSGGGGTLGAGQHDNVRRAATAYLAAIAEAVPMFEAVGEAVPPGEGFVQMVAVTNEGLRMVRLPMRLAQDPAFPGHALWLTGQEVVTQIRLATPPTD
jgi:hypothetical protein